jgi:hypothetical protein
MQEKSLSRHTWLPPVGLTAHCCESSKYRWWQGASRDDSRIIDKIDVVFDTRTERVGMKEQNC